MSTELIGGAIFLLGCVFTAGGIVYSTRKELAQTKLDINRVGQKIRDEERSAARRHFNACMVQIACTDNREERFKICGLLKED